MTLRRLLLLDLVLIGLLAAGAVKVRQRWLDFEAGHRIQAVQPEPEAARTIPGSSRGPVVGDWTEIVTKNPFSFDRNDIAIVVPKDIQAAPRAPKPFLYGIMSIGKESIASLASGQPGNRRARALKIGETIDNWQVIEIHEKSVVLSIGDARETVTMNDPTAQAPRDYTRTLVSAPAAPVVQSSQPGAPSGTGQTAGAPPAPATQQPPPPGQGKGRWMDTPFGRTFIPDNPQ